MEITLHTPVRDWCATRIVCSLDDVPPCMQCCSSCATCCGVSGMYRYKATADNDLSYWGLDYPPVTAYQVSARCIKAEPDKAASSTATSDQP